MKYVSELTGKVFDTEKDCLAADKEYEKEQAAKKAAEEAARIEYDKRVEELKNAYDTAVKAQEDYEALAVAFDKDFSKKNCECKCEKHGYKKENNGDWEEIDQEDLEDLGKFVSELIDRFPINFR